MSFAEAHFGQIWPVHVDGFIKLLSRLRAAFHGDLDSVLILAVIGSAVLPRHKLLSNISYADFLQDSTRKTLTTPLNTHSIVEITGIPRETVRRKLSTLERKGWAVRVDGKYWAIGDSARSDLNLLTDLSLNYLSTIAAVVRLIEEKQVGPREQFAGL